MRECTSSREGGARAPSPLAVVDLFGSSFTRSEVRVTYSYLEIENYLTIVCVRILELSMR